MPMKFAIGQRARLGIGLLLPQSGLYAGVGQSIANGLNLALAKTSGRLAGREVRLIIADDGSDAATAAANAQRLIQVEKVDVLVGAVHSDSAQGMVKVARDRAIPIIIANAGWNAATGAFCAPNLFRTSFTNWQVNWPMGKVAVDRNYRRVATITWRYTAGTEMIGAFEENFTRLGGTIVQRIQMPFPQMDFAPHLATLAAAQPDAIMAFFAGAGARQFITDYAQSPLKDVPLLGPGFLTEGVRDLPAAEGILTTLHYANALNMPANRRFRAQYSETYGRPADVYAVQGYDSGQLIAHAVEAMKGDTVNRAGLITAMETARIDSPRGSFILSKAHNPVQDIYLRQIRNGEEIVLGIAQRALADPATGCKMAK
ncbi:MAG: ABC transporter substrate-binding protein [Rhodospirillaceae bacterium]|nr:ABC transporter substrate-binding protein [Rhodospirillales bacterium]